MFLFIALRTKRLAENHSCTWPFQFVMEICSVDRTKQENQYKITNLFISLSVADSQTFLLAKRPSAAMSEEKRLPFAGYSQLSLSVRLREMPVL